ncbi:unnamed protein product [Mesocestoides corti]|uniref:LisH domain-containing protein n=1 Tax=Mesocestoides corti TaxID=53468 RepID=A0A0R3U572_MESCO|nr:unnamed protein product [Mesocestoides corti]
MVVLALYVYEYLVYSGAQKAAQTFLQEIGWDKHIVPNEAPGFLFSWWSVFWDLYCAAPERRDTLKHSSDARAFYDFVSFSFHQHIYCVFFFSFVVCDLPCLKPTHSTPTAVSRGFFNHTYKGARARACRCGEYAQNWRVTAPRAFARPIDNHVPLSHHVLEAFVCMRAVIWVCRDAADALAIQCVLIPEFKVKPLTSKPQILVGLANPGSVPGGLQCRGIVLTCCAGVIKVAYLCDSSKSTTVVIDPASIYPFGYVCTFVLAAYTETTETSDFMRANLFVYYTGISLVLVCVCPLLDVPIFPIAIDVCVCMCNCTYPKPVQVELLEGPFSRGLLERAQRLVVKVSACYNEAPTAYLYAQMFATKEFNATLLENHVTRRIDAWNPIASRRISLIDLATLILRSLKRLYPLHLSGPGFHYVQGRNGPPPLLPYQQYVSQQRQLYAPVGSRPCDAKIPGLISMGEQHLDAFLPSSTAAFRPSPNIPSLPIASAPTVTLRHQPRPDGPRGPQVNNGNGGAPVNSSSSAASFSGFSPGGDFQPGPLGTAPQQFGRPQTFHQQRSLPTKLPPCTPNNVVPSQQHWGPSLNHQLSHPADFVSGQSAKVSPDINAATTTMLFDPGLMEPFHPPVSGGEGFTFFEQSDGLPEDSTGGQSITSQISQLLSPSPVQAQRGVSHQQRSLQQSNPNIEEALVLSGPELEMLAGGDDSVEGLEQPVTRASGQGFDCEEIKDSGAPSILFPVSLKPNDDLQAVQNLVDAMQDPIVGGSLPPPPSQQPFCSLKDTETSAALFLHD